jgi:secretion/DNA translocation related TadE-like protein
VTLRGARARSAVRCDRGSGGVLAIAVVAVLAVVALSAVTVGAALAQRQRAVGAADAGALAAADTALGIHPGVPCAAAAAVVAAHGAELAACDVAGVVATVEVHANILGMPVSVRARAGPPR